MWCDSHCHLDLLPEPQQDFISVARQAGVSRFLLPAARWQDWPRVRAMAKPPSIAYALGIHPWYLPDLAMADSLADRINQALGDPAMVAIGESGLDGLRPDFALQQQWFAWHLALATELGLPIIAHAVKAIDPLLQQIKTQPQVRGVVHAFNGSLVQARALIARGWFLGIGGLLLMPNARLKALLPELPLSALLLETDAPAMKPKHLPGEVNQPANLSFVAQAMADLLAMPEQDLAAQLELNRQALFASWS